MKRIMCLLQETATEIVLSIKTPDHIVEHRKFDKKWIADNVLRYAKFLDGYDKTLKKLCVMKVRDVDVSVEMKYYLVFTKLSVSSSKRPLKEEGVYATTRPVISKAR